MMPGPAAVAAAEGRIATATAKEPVARLQPSNLKGKGKAVCSVCYSHDGRHLLASYTGE